MKKFKLNLNELNVESFETGTLKKENGTVKGYQQKYNVDGTIPPTHILICNSRYICYIPSVGGSCYFTCEEDCSKPSCDC